MDSDTERDANPERIAFIVLFTLGILMIISAMIYGAITNTNILGNTRVSIILFGVGLILVLIAFAIKPTDVDLFAQRVVV